MTVQELEASGAVFVHADDIAEVLETKAQSIRSQAQADPSKLGFKVVVVGKRVLIPRESFLNYIKS